MTKDFTLLLKQMWYALTWLMWCVFNFKLASIIIARTSQVCEKKCTNPLLTSSGPVQGRSWMVHLAWRIVITFVVFEGIQYVVHCADYKLVEDEMCLALSMFIHYLWWYLSLMFDRGDKLGTSCHPVCTTLGWIPHSSPQSQLCHPKLNIACMQGNCCQAYNGHPAVCCMWGEGLMQTYVTKDVLYVISWVKMMVCSAVINKDCTLQCIDHIVQLQ